MDGGISIEQLELRDFLRTVSGFADLSDDALRDVIAQSTMAYARRDSWIIKAGERNEHLFIVRSGAVELYMDGSDFHATLQEGQCFAYPSLMRDGIVQNSVKVVEDSLLMKIPASVFSSLLKNHESIRKVFATAEADRLREAISGSRQQASGDMLFRRNLKDLIRRRELVMGTPDMTISEAAEIMTEKNVSALLISRDPKAQTPDGIITDKDFRRRVLAKGITGEAKVDDIMTRNLFTLGGNDTGFDAYLIMADQGLRHIPIMDGEKAIGLISSSDLVAHFGQSSLHLRRRVEASETVADIASVIRSLPDSFVALVDGGSTPTQTGRLVASVGEAAHLRAYQLAAGETGLQTEPGLLVFGSLARRDQTAVSDQDNGLLMPSDASIPADQLETFTHRFCSILDQVGYVYCGGDIMAQNPSWQRDHAGWIDQFRRWITVPDPKSVMHTTIFFDMRMIRGDQDAFNRLFSEVTALAKDSKMFLAHLAGDSSKTAVPIGFFRQFVLSKEGGKGKTLNLKKQGVVPVVDLARLYGLSVGSTNIETLARLDDAAADGLMNTRDANDLKDTWRFISDIRIKHQANRIRAGETPDNLVAPDELSDFDQQHLKDAFAIIRSAQKAALNHFAGGSGFS